MPEWKHQYFRSCDKYIMAETLSPTFVGLQFKEVKYFTNYIYDYCLQHILSLIGKIFFAILK